MLFSANPAVVPLILLAAMALDAWLGDPAWLFTRVPHPVAVFGRLAASAETILNRGSNTTRFVLGLLLTTALIAAAAVVGWAIARIPANWGTVVQIAAAAILLAQRSLYDHVRAVVRPLAIGDLPAARQAVSHIVGRDPDSLDKPAVARAAIETLAENFADGVVAPAFWFLIFGLPGIFAYKAINTLDSMFGYRNPRYQWFGKAAARLDDAASWLPARLAGFALVLAATLTPRANARAAIRTMARDAGNNPSPNAGWPEAAMAGAIAAALLGPRSYGGVAAGRPWIGAGFTQPATGAHVSHALAVYVRACIVLAVTLAAIAVTASTLG